MVQQQHAADGAAEPKPVLMCRLLTIAFSLAFLAPGAAWAAGGHGDLPHHHLGLFAGAGAETKKGKPDENGFALGLEYELRFHHNWGVGAVFEALGKDTLRDAAVVVPVSLHPGGKWRLFAGPGMEFLEEKNKKKALFRLGVGYEIPLGAHWNLAPELIADFIEGGATTWIVGLALGYEF